jgi:hypothetical protein
MEKYVQQNVVRDRKYHLIVRVPGSSRIKRDNLKFRQIYNDLFEYRMPSRVDPASDCTTPELGKLSPRNYLNLGTKVLSGTIPPELGNLSSLYYLRLDSIVMAQLAIPSLKWVG